MRRAWIGIAALTLLLAGCGARPQANSRPPAAAVAPRTGAHCFPAWERRDMRVAAAAKLPVETMEIIGNENAFARVTTGNIAQWLGDPDGTPATVAALMKGWRLADGQVTRGGARLAVSETMHVKTLLLEEKVATKGQMALLSREGPLAPQGGPVTFVFQPFGGGAPATVEGMLQAILDEASKAGAAGLPADYYVARSLDPPPRHLLAAGGGPPSIDPANPLSEKGFVCQQQAFALLMGVDGGYIVPKSVATPLQVSGLSYGFAAGTFATDWNHSGYDSVTWYAIPAIILPRGWKP